ncbi:hypothetical protein SK128_003322 [Halocaridina rubra]|uniref:Tesmin/TSO1-like CXC domain-containing protein n=1 Tax=Halocaridina rubra TaxID=373956 RepID=A0AAN9ABX8_HALRR
MQIIPLGPVVNALGTPKTEAIPGFHALSGGDITGQFAGKGKLTCWQAVKRCSIEKVSAFSALGTCEELDVDNKYAIETFVCQVYEPGTIVAMVWYQADIPHSQLPPAKHHEWKEERGRLVPVPTTNPAAPATVIHLIKCGRKKTSCGSNCSYWSQCLNCSEMCRCRADEEVCSNITHTLLGIDEDGEGDPSV